MTTKAHRLQTLAAALSQASTTNQLANVFVTQALAAVDADLGILAVLNDSQTEFLSLGIAGCSTEVVDRWERFPADAPIPIADAVRNNRPIFLETLEERQSRYPLPAGDRFGRALAVLPIRQGNVAGGLGFAYPTDKRFEAEECIFLGKIADLCGQALERVTPTKRILVVDDYADTVESTAMLLGLLGHEVRVALDGRQAIEIARVFRPDTVLLDLGMPGMSGYDVARQLRQEPTCKDALLVAVSGYGREEDRHRASESGFNAHLLKPVELDTLKALLVNGRHN